jgi:hypothetical protein
MGTFSDNGSAHEHLIRDLAGDLEPVRRLKPPAVRAFGWLAFVAVIAVALARFGDLPALQGRLSASPDMWLSVAGSVMTAVLAALAAFQLSLPDANRAWALLPLPAALLWVTASGLGCLRAWLVPGTHVAELTEARDCLMFIISISIPLSILMFMMLRRACSLQPGLTAAIAGLATGAAAATLLNFFHPFDAAATDLAVHACAIAVVIVASWAFSGRLLRATS